MSAHTYLQIIQFSSQKNMISNIKSAFLFTLKYAPKKMPTN